MSEETVPARPYVHLLNGSDPAEVMRATPERLAGILSRLSAAQIANPPAPGKWSVREILCHIADCEVAWAWRLRQTYGEPHPTLQPFEQDAWARAYRGSSYTFEAAWGTWKVLRAWNLSLLDTLSEGDKMRPARHPELGELTLWNIVEIAAGHDLHHLSGLEKLAAEQPRT